MKKLILIVSVAFMGCEQQKSNNAQDIGNDYSVETIDGCQYITYEYGFKGANTHYFALTHKGNCNNPIHKSTNER